MYREIHRNAAFGPMAAAHKHSGQIPGLFHRHPAYHGSFCKSCCHPVSKCCCSRECIKESKELLVEPATKTSTGTVADNATLGLIKNRIMSFSTFGHSPEMAMEVDKAAGLSVNTSALNTALDAANVAVGSGDAIIGGGCCVHLSVEYMQNINETMLLKPDVVSAVVVGVLDSEGTVMSWSKFKFSAGYHIKEGIIATKPGAKLVVAVLNAIARVRWCEIFSC